MVNVLAREGAADAGRLQCARVLAMGCTRLLCLLHICILAVGLVAPVQLVCSVIENEAVASSIEAIEHSSVIRICY